MYIVPGISAPPSSLKSNSPPAYFPLPRAKHAPAYWNPFNSITHRHNLKRISIQAGGRAAQGREGREVKGRSVKQLVTGSPCSSLPLCPFPSFSRSFTYDYCLLSHMVQGAGLRLIVLVCSCTTRLSAACNMYLPFFSLSAPCHGISFSSVFKSPAPAPAPAPAPTLALRFTCSNCHWSV